MIQILTHIYEDKAPLHQVACHPLAVYYPAPGFFCFHICLQSAEAAVKQPQLYNSNGLEEFQYPDRPLILFRSVFLIIMEFLDYCSATLLPEVQGDIIQAGIA